MRQKWNWFCVASQCIATYVGDHTMAGNAQFEATPQPRFMVDHMLIKLGKYLRVLGYDAEWGAAHTVRTHELITRSNAEGRIFLTRNRRLAAQYPAPLRVMSLRETDPARQLEAVVEQFGLDRTERLFTKCIRCNVFLHPVPDKATIRERVHPNVYARFEQFHTCPSCGTVFWKGTHVANTRRKLGITD